MAEEKHAQAARKGLFTAIELLATMVAITTLITMCIPTFKEMRAKAKFVRWFAYNAQWNRDADCVVNFNFQEGKGTTLQNKAEACDWQAPPQRSFNARDYDGIMSGLDKYGKLSTSNANFKWSTGGRWGKYKKALFFKYGLNNYVQIGNPKFSSIAVKNDAVLDLASGDVYAMALTGNKTGSKTKDLSKIDPQRDALDFTPLDSFTIIAWIRFGDENGNLTNFRNYQCVFSRAMWGDQGVVNPESSSFSSAQYDLYTDNKSGSYGQGSFDVDVFTLCPGYSTTAVDFKKKEWKQVALRYRYPPPPVRKGESASDKVYRSVDVFYKGHLQGGKRATYNTQANGSRSKNIAILGGVPTSYDGGWPFAFEGYIDEFMIFKRALNDNEILGDQLLGADGD